MGRALNRPNEPLTAAGIERGARKLAATDERLRHLYESNGAPPLWERETGFATLVKIVLEQQVSLDSAAAAFSNLTAALEYLSPAHFLKLDDRELKEIGFSRQKAGYCRGIAAGLLDGSIDLEGVAAMEDETARDYLMAIRGIGEWTADVYLLFALRRRDIWPNGDRALVVSIRDNRELGDVPTYEEAARLAHRWSPWRSVAARMLWHNYLLERGRSLD